MKRLPFTVSLMAVGKTALSWAVVALTFVLPITLPAPPSSVGWELQAFQDASWIKGSYVCARIDNGQIGMRCDFVPDQVIQ